MLTYIVILNIVLCVGYWHGLKLVKFEARNEK